MNCINLKVPEKMFPGAVPSGRFGCLPCGRWFTFEGGSPGKFEGPAGPRWHR